MTELDGQVVGFIALIGTEIGGLFLDPALHHRRFGRAMVDKAARAKGKLTVEVFKQNHIPRQFYTSYGFRGLRKDLSPGLGADDPNTGLHASKLRRVGGSWPSTGTD